MALFQVNLVPEQDQHEDRLAPDLLRILQDLVMGWR